MVTLNAVLVLGAVIFCIGLFGALSRRNAVGILMSIEIMLNAVNITLVGFASAFLNQGTLGTRLTGQVFAIFIITVAAAE
ncbi:MAG TPA: NADH-quinone oxidoreductase subunit NuoK, partial [Ktedonobacterales bacterium]|nr:NADH-quinone oxidoreductase subunit NuoK [Ktedonobacterales bacterium]